MKKRKLEKVEPLELIPSSHTRPTRMLELLIYCPLCSGHGFDVKVLGYPLVLPCVCTEGLRLRCAVPEGTWPLSFSEALAAAERIGLIAEARAWRRRFCRVHGESLEEARARAGKARWESHR